MRSSTHSVQVLHVTPFAFIVEATPAALGDVAALPGIRHIHPLSVPNRFAIAVTAPAFLVDLLTAITRLNLCGGDTIPDTYYDPFEIPTFLFPLEEQ